VTTRSLSKEERQLAYLWLAAAALAVALRPLWMAVAPHLGNCVFRSITAVPCPSCGTTRAATAFLDGDLASAFAANPLAATAGLIFVAGAPLAVLWAVSRWPIPVAEGSKAGWLRVTTAVLVLLNWLYLIIVD
jgi:hypothetical protein